MLGPTRALIDLQALRDNLNLVKRTAADSQVMAVIKADAYGHGMIPVSQALEAADAFAVARIGEAEQLRTAGCDKPIIILSGCLNEQEWLRAAELNLQPVVHHADHVDWLVNANAELGLTIWLKLNTGMHRLGIDPAQVEEKYAQLVAAGAVKTIRWMTHFACADDPASTATDQQIQSFVDLTSHHDGAKSLANSAGILVFPRAHADWVRPGIMLYGASPFINRLGVEDGLKPVMTLRSEVLALRTVEAGGYVGYGATWQALSKTRVAIVAIGYGDGYPRQAEMGTPVRIGHQNYPLIGRVSMDSIAVDVSSASSVNRGDEVILWGKDLPLETIAERCGSIAYHLLCGVSARVPRVYQPVSGTEGI